MRKISMSFLQCSVIFSFVILSFGCAHYSKPPTPVIDTKPVVHHSQQYRQGAAFSRVEVTGKFNVILHTGYAHPRAILRGDSRDLAAVITTVKSGVLHVSLAESYPRYGSVNVEIESQRLNAFEYHGAGTITGNRLNTGLFDLTVDNQGGKTQLHGQIGLRKLVVKQGYVEITGINTPYLLTKLSGKAVVRLSGNVNLTTLDMENDSRLSLYWVKSKELFIQSHGKSFIQLAGVVDKLHVELWGESRFNGRYLRAARAFIKTHNKSVAEITAVKRQHTLAKDTSDIHFYHIPTIKTDFMANAGAVLDMRDLGVPWIQEESHTRY